MDPSSEHSGLTLVDVADELFRRALHCRRRPTYFTIGKDIEARILWQIAVQNASEETSADALEEYTVESLSILGLPVQRMDTPGIALHSEALEPRSLEEPWD